MRYLFRNLRSTLDETAEELTRRIAKKLRLSPGSFELMLYRESIDARHNTVVKNLQVLITTDIPPVIPPSLTRDVVAWSPIELDLTPGTTPMPHRPIIIGSGPCGLFAGLILAEAGLKPIIIERGRSVELRHVDIERFWSEGILDPSSNVQFGEGGAGTFSDGKLTSRSKDPRVCHVLSTFVRFGAPEEILWQQYPHIGTDILSDVVRAIRRHIEGLGGTYHFETALTGIRFGSTPTSSGKRPVCGIDTTKGHFDCEHLILAIGHSARDTFRMLHEMGVAMENKPFAMGFRIEHPQLMIEKAQYGAFANDPRLPRASYRLTARTLEPEDPHGVYTFCMCPGGYVVNAASEAEALCVNGMSFHARNGANANAAVLTTLSTEELPDALFSGMLLQEQVEREAFRLGGGDYSVPVQTVADFIAGRPSTMLGAVHPTVLPRYTLTDLNGLYPPQITAAIKEALIQWDKKIPGFCHDDAVLTGVETRSSSPIRLLRDDDYESESIAGLYPCGEGSGYAGGIVSSAIDGLKVAQMLVSRFSPQA